jgi:hypothetical protein
MAQDIAYLRKTGSRCVNDTLISVRMEPSSAAGRNYELSVRDLCEQELATVERWQPPAPQSGPQAVVAERVRQELWGLKRAWLRAMTVAYGYAFAATSPPGIVFPAFTEVVKADHEERVLETRLRREWGLP